MAVDGRTLQHDSKTIKKFYEVACLLHSLNVARGDRIKQNLPTEDDEYNLSKCRREFADALAYISVKEKGGDTVTAVALGKSDEKVKIWIAMNKEVTDRDPVWAFLDKVLQELDRIADQQNKSPDRKKQEDILRDYILKFNKKKIYSYYTGALSFWNKISSSASAPRDDDDFIALKSWVQEAFYKNAVKLRADDMAGLAKKSHILRERNHGLDVLGALERLTTKSDALTTAYERLHKLLCKLGKHITLYRKLVRARKSLRNDFAGGYSISQVPHSPSPNESESFQSDLASIAGSIFPDNDGQNALLNHVHRFYDSGDLSQELSQNCSSPRLVHAEIKLIDHFDRTSSRFLDENDPYIGCSKPACYLCFSYIRNHPRGYALPPSHQKLYSRWRLPDVQVNDPDSWKRFEDQKRFLVDTTKTLYEDLRAEIRIQIGPWGAHADSTAGASSNAAIRVPMSMKSLREIGLHRARQLSGNSML
ncbi:hypothetical protein ASPWEDRAFT_113272 [Aspergillus wentii DTO 134E9]|uniref:Uncharacterized protein n=1 Tax=Aspergillus wentii DTO 134E9 TaxID=1073089 RepID=A0A1L9RFT4_ASPWE|nr:uncharacterized protein ASPWEDRAFT_113272 [Aspergillus wentii DTO 134E9]OJJ33738.1 hypothetical protein ASPWEDRAFT_113272 [Aspergillus wentii DTO 134E9]